MPQAFKPCTLCSTHSDPLDLQLQSMCCNNWSLHSRRLCSTTKEAITRTLYIATRKPLHLQLKREWHNTDPSTVKINKIFKKCQESIIRKIWTCRRAIKLKRNEKIPDKKHSISKVYNLYLPTRHWMMTYLLFQNYLLI